MDGRHPEGVASGHRSRLTGQLPLHTTAGGPPPATARGGRIVASWAQQRRVPAIAQVQLVGVFQQQTQHHVGQVAVAGGLGRRGCPQQRQEVVEGWRPAATWPRPLHPMATTLRTTATLAGQPGDDPLVAGAKLDPAQDPAEQLAPGPLVQLGARWVVMGRMPVDHRRSLAVKRGAIVVENASQPVALRGRLPRLDTFRTPVRVARAGGSRRQAPTRQEEPAADPRRPPPRLPSPSWV
jgi:hypothetical protein